MMRRMQHHGGTGPVSLSLTGRDYSHALWDVVYHGRVHDDADGLGILQSRQEFTITHKSDCAPVFTRQGRYRRNDDLSTPDHLRAEFGGDGGDRAGGQGLEEGRVGHNP